MMKHVLMIILALLICATAGMAEGEHKGGRDNTQVHKNKIAAIKWNYSRLRESKYMKRKRQRERKIGT